MNENEIRFAESYVHFFTLCTVKCHENIAMKGDYVRNSEGDGSGLFETLVQTEWIEYIKKVYISGVLG
jgi:hypothetical protein